MANDPVVNRKKSPLRARRPNDTHQFDAHAQTVPASQTEISSFRDCGKYLFRDSFGDKTTMWPLAKSQLNGVNGEFTGSDDIDAVRVSGGKKDKNALAQLQRDRREADNKQHSRSSNGDAKRGTKEVNYSKRKEKKQGGTCAKLEAAVEDEKVQQVETLTCYVIPSEYGLYEVQGKAYASIPAGYEVFLGTEDFVPLGGVDIIGKKLLVQSCGVGWFIRSNIDEKNRLNYVTTTACTRQVNDGFSYRDTTGRLVHCGAKEFTIYKPLFTDLLRKVRSDALTDFVVNSCMMIASGQSFLVDGLPDHPIIISTVEAYKHWLFRRRIMQNSSQIKKFITLNYDTLGYHEAQNALHEEAWIKQNHLVVEGKFSPWVEESITADHLDLMSWVPRTDFKVITNRGVDTSSDRFDFGPDGKYPSRFKITKFFAFEGLGSVPFNKHTRNNENLGHGCKRLIGCRGDAQTELRLRSKAVSLAAILLDRSSEFEVRIMRKCIGSRQHSHYEIPETLAVFVRDSFEELKDRVRPHFFSRKLGQAKTWLHASKYKALEQWYAHNPFYGRMAWAQIQHAKSKQRVEFVGSRMFHHEEYMPLVKMEVCIKDELAKYDKPCRLFINLDTESAYAPTLPMHIKFLLHGTHMHRLTYPGTSKVAYLEIFIYAQPDPTQDEMDYVAQKASDARFAEDYLFIALHSDDSVMVGNIGSRSIMCNLDVSSNDSGQDAPAFFGLAVLEGLLSEKLAEGLLDLCNLPIDIRSPTSGTMLQIQFDKPIEPSGHGNTSCLNHVSSNTIGLCIFHELVMTDAPLEECVKNGAEYVGHVMTVDVCECLEDLQFLKFSPVECNGKYVMAANLGRVFKRLGMVDNDLTHLQLGVDVNDFRCMTPLERMNRFWSGVITGLKHEPSNVILDALRSRFDSSRYVVTESSLSWLQDERKDSYYGHSRTAKDGDCTESVMRRYRLSSAEVDELVALIHDLDVGQRFKLSSIAKMFEKDYGVSQIKESPLPDAIGTRTVMDAGSRRGTEVPVNSHRLESDNLYDVGP